MGGIHRKHRAVLPTVGLASVQLSGEHERQRYRS
jgi:hypothetical protein